MSLGIFVFLKPWRIKNVPWVGKPTYYLGVTLIVFGVLACVATYAACHSIRSNGPFAGRMVEIGIESKPLQVTAHDLLTRWDAVHEGRTPPQELSIDRVGTVVVAQAELSKKWWYKRLPASWRISLHEAVVQLNVERQPKTEIKMPNIDVSDFGSLFSSKK